MEIMARTAAIGVQDFNCLFTDPLLWEPQNDFLCCFICQFVI